jgi:hypothetical protein
VSRALRFDGSIVVSVAIATREFDRARGVRGATAGAGTHNPTFTTRNAKTMNAKSITMTNAVLSSAMTTTLRRDAACSAAR